MGAVIISAMKKTRFHEVHRYDFGGLMTHFLQSHEVEEEALDYILVVDMHPVDVTQMRGLYVSHGPILTFLEHHARDYEIIAHMYGL